ncbi:hypothetical protein GS448_24465 [Rhodococcus hoagii]|nr:hypothetical protein [Prescottella equi]MBM4670091.1 hypothetical protein [Prescottella equi]NKV87450.1 hypothetical protein [Prescottella equi]
MSERIDWNFRPAPSERSMWVRFWLWIAFVLGVEVLLLYGLQAWWGDGAAGWVVAVVLGVSLTLLCVGGYAMNALQQCGQWEVEEL